MPRIYLSPSTQEYNLYVNGGSEEYYMNLIADDMVPLLRANTIQVTRNDPNTSAAVAIRESNASNYDLHLALHSNAAPDSRSGQVRGSDVYYYPGSVNGQRAANIFVANLKKIYPDPNLVRALTTTSLGEVSKTRATALLVEIAYHDNLEDALWIQNNIPEIAENLVLSVTEYFDLPFVTPVTPFEGKVVLTYNGVANIYEKPALESSIIAVAYNQTPITVLGEYQDWYSVSYDGILGFVRKVYVQA